MNFIWIHSICLRLGVFFFAMLDHGPSIIVMETLSANTGKTEDSF